MLLLRHSLENIHYRPILTLLVICSSTKAGTNLRFKDVGIYTFPISPNEPIRTEHVNNRLFPHNSIVLVRATLKSLQSPRMYVAFACLCSRCVLSGAQVSRSLV